MIGGAVGNFSFAISMSRRYYQHRTTPLLWCENTVVFRRHLDSSLLALAADGHDQP